MTYRDKKGRMSYHNPVGSSYPGKRRVRLAYEKGRYGKAGICPYQHPTLIRKWKEGVLARRSK